MSDKHPKQCRFSNIVFCTTAGTKTQVPSTVVSRDKILLPKLGSNPSRSLRSPHENRKDEIYIKSYGVAESTVASR